MRRLVWFAACSLAAQDAGVEFFEKKIRPVLTAQCYACHSSKAKPLMGGLALDTRDGARKSVLSGKLMTAVRYTDAHLKMPPAGRLPDSVIADLEQWIGMGAPDPRAEPAAAKPRGIDFEKGRKWWAFQPVRELAAPRVSKPSWPKKKLDAFILAALDANRLEPSAEADRRTLIRRASFDLTGLAPTYEEAAAFIADPASDAYETLIGRLLASPRYGERWGRYWLDVARWAEDHPTSEATNQPHRFAWRYRDWVIEAFNRDLPYDRFVKQQFAADLMPGFERQDMRALGYIGNSPMYHKDLRLSTEVIGTLTADDWDERVDAVTRGLLGLTVACARCHDHKFDPIATRDYYALAGVFASTWMVKRPLAEMDPAAEEKLVWDFEKLYRVDGAARNLDEAKTISAEAMVKVKEMRAEVAALKKELDKVDTPLTHAIVDAGVWIGMIDPTVTWIELKPGEPRNLPVFIGGNVANPGEVVPRRFLTVLSKGEPAPFQNGSGRLELAEKIVGEAAPLAARVIVNRVWGWHFGRPLVPTPSDFGVQGDPPSHPELLDDLTARFIAHGWSLKWLHREIMLSAVYRQASRRRETAFQTDPSNKWLWRMAPRRMEVEAWRDAILQASGSLDVKMGGPSVDLDARDNFRRTVYARVSRSRVSPLFRLYDFPDVTQHSPGRDITTTPVQQLFAMNSEFMQTQAAALAARTEGDGTARVRLLYRRVFGRDPRPKEVELGLKFLSSSPNRWVEYAQALLETNELIYLE